MKETFLFNPNNPKKSFDVYIDKNPKDTIPIKYTTIDDVKNTIKKLEKLYKTNKYEHTRIFKVAMIMMVRLEAIYKNYKKGYKRFVLARRYKKFLNNRTRIKDNKDRKKMVFKTSKNTSKKQSKQSKTSKKQSKTSKKQSKTSKKQSKNTSKKQSKKQSKTSKKQSKTKKYINKYMNKREYLLEKCGLPKIRETDHCFNDGTHHTCCHLNKKAREYADNSGNPIGKLSEDVFEKKHGRRPNDNEKTPWCTCSGSEVCGYYNDNISDKTTINFINNPNKNQIAKNIKGKKCEGYVRDYMNVIPHGTPGIVSKNGGKCENKDIIKFEDIQY